MLASLGLWALAAALWLPTPTLAPAADAPDDLAALSDEFNDAGSLSRWRQFHQAEGWPSMVQRLDVNQTARGQLYLAPTTSGWYADFHGTYLYQEVTGDFLVTSRVHVTGKTTELPKAAWSLAGLMVREARPAVTPASWQPGGENWLFLTAGVAEPVNQFVFESKSTVNSRSNLKLRPAKTGWVELGILRVRSAFVLLYRYEGQPWQVHERFHRRDLPRTLQVGLNAYTDWNSARPLHNDPQRFNTTVVTNGQPDLALYADYVRFSRPAYRVAAPYSDGSELTDYSLTNDELLRQLKL
ncbi:hypothetical protein [Hymenobacter sp. B81]|uniref:hypothetical protein n=1 Tax=Hymenobacter sp. B81 TaxID=3344878 RepID=UPI0037DDC3A6